MPTNLLSVVFNEGKTPEDRTRTSTVKPPRFPPDPKSHRAVHHNPWRPGATQSPAKQPRDRGAVPPERFWVDHSCQQPASLVFFCAWFFVCFSSNWPKSRTFVPKSTECYRDVNLILCPEEYFSLGTSFELTMMPVHLESRCVHPLWCTLLHEILSLDKSHTACRDGLEFQIRLSLI